jgi:hypothetical protein
MTHILLEMLPVTGVNAGVLVGAVVFLNKKIDGVKADVYTQLNNGIKEELAEIRGYLKGKKES